MLDHAFESALVAFLQTDPKFAGIHFFTGHDDEEHALPAVTVSSKSEPLAGSASVFRADVTILAESEAHDSNPDDHAALVEKVRARLASKAAVVATLNAGNQVHLYGYAFTGSSLDVDGVRFRTALTLKAGYGTP
jgi:hypothetical protein